MKVNINDLVNVKGIGSKTIDRIKEYFLSQENYISRYNPELHLEENNIYHGDCLELMNGIPDKSIDMILADLPYGTTACKWDNVIDLNKLWMQYERIIKNDGAIVLTATQPFTTDLINSNPNLFRYCWHWVKPYSVGFMNANKMPLRNVEDVLVFYKQLPTYNPQGVVEINQKQYRRKDKETTVYNDMGLQEGEYIQKYTNYPTQILTFGREGKTIHPTQKPVELFKYLIETYTNEGDLVLDNVSGSGTTAEACILSGRRFICIELDYNYYQLSKERIKKVMAV